MPEEILVQEGLAPYHFAGMVYNPSKGALNQQTQRLLLIGSHDQGEEAEPLKQGLQQITSSNRIAEFYPNSDSQIVKMLEASFAANPMVERFAIALSSEQTIEDALNMLPEKQFTQIASGFNSKEDLKLVNIELAKRWDHTLQIDGHYFTAVRGNVNEVKIAYSENESLLNDLAHVTVMAISDSRTDPGVWAAALAAVNAKYVSKPFLPYTSLEIPLPRMIQNQVDVSLPSTEYKLAERNLLLSYGISTHVVESGKAKIDRLVTMHSKDKSYRDLNKKQILSYLRYDFVKFLKTMFPRSALSKDDTQADGDVVTPKSARDLSIARHIRWKQEKYVQDPDGDFKNLVNVRVDENNGETLRFFLPVQLMGQLRRTITSIAFTP